MKQIKEKGKQIDKADDYKNKLLISEDREILKNVYNERLNKTEELTKKKLIIMI